MRLLESLLMDSEPMVQQTAALALSRLAMANHNDKVDESVIEEDNMRMDGYSESVAEENVSILYCTHDMQRTDHTKTHNHTHMHVNADAHIAIHMHTCEHISLCHALRNAPSLVLPHSCINF